MKKNKTEFSKKIFYVIITLFIIIVGFSMVLMWRTEDTSALSYLIPSITGLTATCVGTYMWKSRAENILKIQQSGVSIDEFNELKNKIDDMTIIKEENY